MRPNLPVLTLSFDPYRLTERTLCPVSMFHQAIFGIVDEEMHPIHIAAACLPENFLENNLFPRFSECFLTFEELTCVSISWSNARSPSTAPCRYSC